MWVIGFFSSHVKITFNQVILFAFKLRTFLDKNVLHLDNYACKLTSDNNTVFTIGDICTMVIRTHLQNFEGKIWIKTCYKAENG